MTKLIRLNDISARRSALAEAVSNLDSALSSPAGDLPKWRSKVTTALQVLDRKISHSTEEANSLDGLFNYMEIDFPYLARRISQHRVDYERLQQSISALRETLANLSDQDLSDNIFIIRTQAVEFMGHVSLITQSDADLFYDAYNVDISEFASMSSQREVANF